MHDFNTNDGNETQVVSDCALYVEPFFRKLLLPIILNNLARDEVWETVTTDWSNVNRIIIFNKKFTQFDLNIYQKV